MADDIKRLINDIAGYRDCILFQPEPCTPAPGYELPEDLTTFYKACDGAILFRESAYSINIVRCSDFVPATPVIAGEEAMDYAREMGALLPNIADDWFMIAVANQDSDTVVTIDLNPTRLGRCYDSSLGRHANPGYAAIIALSFTEFLFRSIQMVGSGFYWDAKSFTSYGDAYDS